MDDRSRPSLQPLLQWVATFRGENKRNPSKKDVPSDLTHLWPLLASLRTENAKSAGVQSSQPLAGSRQPLTVVQRCDAVTSAGATASTSLCAPSAHQAAPHCQASSHGSSRQLLAQVRNVMSAASVITTTCAIDSQASAPHRASAAAHGVNKQQQQPAPVPPSRHAPPPSPAGAATAVAHSPAPDRGGCATPQPTGGAPSHVQATPGSAAGLELGPTPVAEATPSNCRLAGNRTGAAARLLSFELLDGGNAGATVVPDTPPSAQAVQPLGGRLNRVLLGRVRVLPSQRQQAGSTITAAAGGTSTATAAGAAAEANMDGHVLDAPGVAMPQQGGMMSPPPRARAAVNTPQRPSGTFASPSLVRPGQARAAQAINSFATNIAERLRCQALPSATKPTAPPDDATLDSERHSIVGRALQMVDEDDETTKWLLGDDGGTGATAADGGDTGTTGADMFGGDGAGGGTRGPSRWPPLASGTLCQAPVRAATMADEATACAGDDLWPMPPPDDYVAPSRRRPTCVPPPSSTVGGAPATDSAADLFEKCDMETGNTLQDAGGTAGRVQTGRASAQAIAMASNVAGASQVLVPRSPAVRRVPLATSPAVRRRVGDVGAVGRSRRPVVKRRCLSLDPVLPGVTSMVGVVTDDETPVETRAHMSPTSHQKRRVSGVELLRGPPAEQATAAALDEPCTGGQPSGRAVVLQAQRAVQSGGGDDAPVEPAAKRPRRRPVVKPAGARQGTQNLSSDDAGPSAVPSAFSAEAPVLGGGRRSGRLSAVPRKSYCVPDSPGVRDVGGSNEQSAPPVRPVAAGTGAEASARQAGQGGGVTRRCRKSADGADEDEQYNERDAHAFMVVSDNDDSSGGGNDSDGGGAYGRSKPTRAAQVRRRPAAAGGTGGQLIGDKTAGAGGGGGAVGTRRRLTGKIREALAGCVPSPGGGGGGGGGSGVLRRQAASAAIGAAKRRRQQQQQSASAAAAAGGTDGVLAGGIKKAPRKSSTARNQAGAPLGVPLVAPAATRGLMGLHVPAPAKGRRRPAPAKGGGKAGGRDSKQSGNNFVRIQLGGARAKHSFGYQSKSASNGRFKAERTRMRRVNGKMVKVVFRAPKGAGQGGETVEGFGNEARCFRCGGLGHWARACPHELGTAPPAVSDTLPEGHPVDAAAAAAAPAWTAPRTADGPAPPPGSNINATVGATAAAAAATAGGATAAAGATAVAPAQALPEELQGRDPTTFTDDELRVVLRRVFGHEDFRGRQLEILRLVLAGRTVLGILPTGAGKSLCFQLPAVLLPGVVLVVSPLLALMRNQLEKLPPGVPGAMLSGEMSGTEVLATLAKAAAGHLKLLYVAPEKLLAPVVMSALRSMVQISLVCIDEAHCVAEWGHSFRPAYFRLGFALRSQIRPRAVLALTATATRPTERCIAQVLGLPDDCILRDSPLRDNLGLRVLHDNGGTRADRAQQRLLTLLKSGALAKTASVIVYVTYQSQADETAAFLTRNGLRSSAYHAGKAFHQRLVVEDSFCRGTLRVVVATVAFGMGVDNTSVGAVVHLTMPRSMEDYVQQVGRAGRDGTPAQCFLMLDSDDYVRLRSLSFCNAVERSAVRELLSRVFQPTPAVQLAAEAAAARQAKALQASQATAGVVLTENEGGAYGGGAEEAAAVRQAAGQEGPGQAGQGQGDAGAASFSGCSYGVMPLKETCGELDMAEETMETVMSYLQGYDGSGYVRVLPVTNVHVDVRFHATPVHVLALRHPVVKALLDSRPRVTQGSHRGVMARMVAVSGMSSSQIIKQLVDLAKMQEIHFVTAPAKALAWQVLRPPPEDLPALAAELHDRLYHQSAVNVRRLDVMFAHACLAAKQQGDEQEQYLRSAMSSYFLEVSERQPMPAGAPELPVTRPVDRVGREVNAFLRTNRQKINELTTPLTATAVARIFHGLTSAAQPRDQWDKCGWWGKYGAWDFAFVAQQASEQLRQMQHATAQQRQQW